MGHWYHARGGCPELVYPRWELLLVSPRDVFLGDAGSSTGRSSTSPGPALAKLSKTLCVRRAVDYYLTSRGRYSAQSTNLLELHPDSTSICYVSTDDLRPGNRRRRSGVLLYTPTS